MLAALLAAISTSPMKHPGIPRDTEHRLRLPRPVLLLPSVSSSSSGQATSGNAGREDELRAKYTDEELEEMGDRSPLYRYAL